MFGSLDSLGSNLLATACGEIDDSGGKHDHSARDRQQDQRISEDFFLLSRIFNRRKPLMCAHIRPKTFKQRS